MIEKEESPGNDLLSHTVTSAVPSALEGLTSRFGMELGVSPPLKSPEEQNSYDRTLQGLSPAKISTLRTEQNAQANRRIVLQIKPSTISTA
jgi:hypothetical protein